VAAQYFEEIFLDVKKRKELIQQLECSDVDRLAGVSRNVAELLKCPKASLEVVWDPRVP